MTRYDRDEYDDEDEEADVWKTCAVAPVKDDVACIFARSTRGEKEFAEFSVNQRAAVALARYLQDPLVEFAGDLLLLLFLLVLLLFVFVFLFLSLLSLFFFCRCRCRWCWLCSRKHASTCCHVSPPINVHTIISVVFGFPSCFPACNL